MTRKPPQRRAHASQRATGRFGVLSLVFSLFTALLLGIPGVSMAADPPAAASWHGRAIQEPQTQRNLAATTVALPKGWAAGPVRLGTGFHRAGGSARVRDVQRRLWNLGFRPGPVDGLYGPQTRAAVQWFQIKHGFKADGVVGPGTLALLRERTGGRPATPPEPVQEPVRGEPPAARGTSPQPQPVAQPVGRGQKPAGGQGHGVALRGLIPFALLLLAAPLAFVALRRQRALKPPKPRRPTAAREAVVGPALQSPPAAPSPEPAPAIGYVRSSRDRTELARHAGTIRQACTSRGWRLAELVRDDQASANGSSERPGLAAAMERLSGPGDSRLIVSKLAHLSRSATELTSLFEWFAQNDVQVIAADAGIDTTTPEGKRAAQVLLTKVARRQAEARANGNGRANGRNGHNGANGNGRNGAHSNGHNGTHGNGHNGTHGNGHNGTHGNGNGKVPAGAGASNGKGDDG